MNIYFYNNFSEVNAFPKDLRNTIVINGTLREKCDVLSPIITIENTSTFNITDYNYVEIEEFNRFYFIDNYNYITNNLIEISLSVDVLETYKYAILQSTQYVTRNENFNADYMSGLSDDEPIKKIYNNSKYINDNYIQVYPSFDEQRILATNSYTDRTFEYPDNLYYGVVLNASYSHKTVTYQGSWLTQSNLSANNCYIFDNIQMAQFSTALWQNNDILKSLLPWYTEPLDCIVNLYEIPFMPILGYKIPIVLGDSQYLKYTDYDGSQTECTGYTISLTNGIQGAYEFVISKSDVDKLLTHNFLDYSPYTKFQLYIPFFGYIDIDNSIIENLSDDTATDGLYIRYSFDVTTATLYVRVTVNQTGIMLFENSTIVGNRIAWSGKQYSDYNKSVVRTLLGVGVAVGGGVIAGSIASKAIDEMPKSILSDKQYGQLLRKGVPVTSVEENYRDMKNKATKAIDKSNKITTTSSIINGLSNLATLSPQIHSQSTYSSNASYACLRIPFLQVKRYNRYYPINYGKMVGYPVENSVYLGLLSGFTICGQVHLEATGDNLTARFGKATKFELEEIENLLKSGVIINEVL